MSVGLAIFNIARWTVVMLTLGEAQSDLETQKFNASVDKDKKKFGDIERKLQEVKTKFVMAKDNMEVWKDILKSWLSVSKLFNELLRSN